MDTAGSSAQAIIAADNANRLRVCSPVGGPIRHYRTSSYGIATFFRVLSFELRQLLDSWKKNTRRPASVRRKPFFNREWAGTMVVGSGGQSKPFLRFCEPLELAHNLEFTKPSHE